MKLDYAGRWLSNMAGKAAPVSRSLQGGKR